MTEQEKEELAELNKWLAVYTKDRCWEQMDIINKQISKLVNKE